MVKRVSLSERRAKDKQGVDALFEAPKESPAPEQKLAKVTLYIRPEQVLAVEAIQLSERKRTGKKPDKSDLAQEAFDLLVEKYRVTD